ncbi:hypothetical protein [Georgenia wutianyii]|nr:hypothetical protein [Georgenia wutianyii]
MSQGCKGCPRGARRPAIGIAVTSMVGVLVYGIGTFVVVPWLR